MFRKLLLTFLLLTNLHTPIALKGNYSAGIQNVEVQYSIGENIQFSGAISEPLGVNEVLINIQTNTGMSFSSNASIAQDGSFRVEITNSQFSPSPFSRVYYWFTLEYANGSSATSPSYWFDYIDNRFSWSESQSKWFNIFWTGSDATYGDKLQEIALAGLKSATQALPVSPDLPISIYVYPDITSLQQIVSSSDPSWIAGEAIPGSNTILIARSSDITSDQELTVNIPHEFTHLLEYKISQAGYYAAPAWLLEGLAENSSALPDSNKDHLLQKAYEANQLIPMEQLCSPFSPISQTASLAYAESASFVQYLTMQFGTDKMQQLLSDSSSGYSCSKLVETNLGASLSSLDDSWKKDTFSQKQRNNWLSYLPYLLVIIIILSALIVFRRIRIKKRDQHHE